MSQPIGRATSAQSIVSIVALLLCSERALSAQERAATPAKVVVVDLTPKFLAFYDSAKALDADAEQRWQLWQRLVGFAAVPPGEFGQRLARRLLDSAWTRYPGALDRIRRGAAGLGVSPDTALREVVDLLGCGRETRVRLTIFVGGFEANAFAFGVRDGFSNIAIPVEAGNPAASIVHEFAHAVHRDGCVTFSTDYGGTLAELVMTEGLAMRVVERLRPGHGEAYYTAAAPGWLEAVRMRRDSLLKGVRDHLDDRGTEVIQRFTFGTGASGLSREGYYAGWEVIGTLVTRMGMSFHDIATTPPAEYPRLVNRAIESLLVTRPPR